MLQQELAKSGETAQFLVMTWGGTGLEFFPRSPLRKFMVVLGQFCKVIIWALSLAFQLTLVFSNQKVFCQTVDAL